MSDQKTLIFAHRGIPARLPENSLAGFQYTIDHSADGIEFDVHLTKDRVPVVMHDERIDRTTNGNGFIKDYQFAELKKFKLADGQTIPSLKEILKLVENKSIRLNLEFKTDLFHYENIEAIVMEMVKKTNLKYQIIYSSFYLNSLKKCYQMDKNGQYCFLTPKYLHNAHHFMKINHLAGLHLKHYQKLANTTERIWTIDDPLEEKKLLKKHVAGIFTNNFQKAAEILNEQ
ncbi:glycerophosphodiester phosphodiesterase [Oenococcus oeni]|uniref:glycerophosphodiester phosphodiesterase family protein n=1 Tax=Oenococcus oeni TaxID=1247 RepID=UPI00095168F6|nr:glycerophosphodiester phosphodiesterase family protein [Oenococcus oeni]OLQ39556.1 glycerophosphodiester phosphodiesterase [Oenococcus oeni]